MSAFSATKTNAPRRVVATMNFGVMIGHSSNCTSLARASEIRKKFTTPYWAVFIVNLNDETMFGGLYQGEISGLWNTTYPSRKLKAASRRREAVMNMISL